MIKTYRIHDLMRDLCLSEGKAMNFLDIHNQQQHCTGGVTSTNAKKLRRYAVHPKSEAISRYEIHCNQKFRIENLINLQTFGCIKAGSWVRKGCFDKLSNLRKLSVCSTSRLQTDIILEEVVGKRSSISSSSDDQYQSPIRKLGISSIEKLPNLIFDSLSCCHSLHTLTLGGRLDVINLQKYPQNLSKLHLSGSMLEEDPMTTVQYLPNLKGFKLATRIRRKLSMLPEGLRFIISLEQLNILGMPLVKDRIVKGVGEDWYKVQHVPSITAQ
ncbi:hypothetical protein C5167_046476 [Papaver somniferum]|uniref:NB-ARC domain-containing protein n=1 Tax=Papaver somniferum TaxID=3469 RepID=A0A4Y7LHK7_PAPSO|nr:hypothetical protein C5167_046476 [Papaver somniferum]